MQRKHTMNYAMCEYVAWQLGGFPCISAPTPCNVNHIAGLQISLNYLMKFNAELTPNSSRDYLGGVGGLLGVTCLAPGLIPIPCFCCFFACTGGSRSFLDVEFEKCDLPFERRVAIVSEWRVSTLFSADLAKS